MTSIATPVQMQQFLTAEERHRIIIAAYKSGDIDQRTVERQCKENMVLFDNEWWALGLDSNKWHKFVNNVWVMETPPFVI